MKKVGILIYSLGSGGAEKVACRMVDILKERYEMTVFIMRSDNRVYDCNCEVVDLGAGGSSAIKNEVCTALRLNKVLKSKKIDVLISLMEAANQINLLFNHCCKRVLSVHCYYGKELWDEFQNSLKDKRERFCVKHFYKNADAISVLTKVGKEAYIRDYGVTADIINVINNPYDMPEIMELAKADIDNAAMDFIRSHDTTVTVGRIAEQKNYFQLIDTFKLLSAKNSKAGLMILGSGPLESKLKDYINELGLVDKIYMAGFVKNPYSYISKCKMFISLSNFEGFPNVMVETMACNVPVAYTDCLSGPREILDYNSTGSDHVIDTKYGLLLPDIGNKRDVDIKAMKSEIADVWDSLLMDSERRDEYARNAIERINAFSYETVGNKWVELIEKVTS